LTPTEKGKFCLDIMKEYKTDSDTELSKILNVPRQDIIFWRDVVNIKKSTKVPAAGKVADSTIVETKGRTVGKLCSH